MSKFRKKPVVIEGFRRGGVMTNADRIRSMNDEDLAEFISLVFDGKEGMKMIDGILMHDEDIVNWLKMPGRVV